MGTTGLLFELRELGVVLSIEGDRLAFDAPGGVLDDALLGRMRAEREGLLAALKADTAPDAVEHPVRCPWCGPADLRDDPEGLRCVQCDRLAWVAVGRSIVRVDCIDDDLEGLAHEDVLTCPGCGRWCDVESVTGAWRCSRCEPDAVMRRRRTLRVLDRAERLRSRW